MHKHIVALLMVFLSFVACQQADQEALPLATKTAFLVPTDSIRGKAIIPPPREKILLQSNDRGQSWQDISAGLPSGVEPERLFALEDIVFLGGQSGFYSSMTGHKAPEWEKEILPDEKITSLYPGHTGLYAYGLGSGFFLNMQGSGIWIPINNLFKGKAVNTFLETSDGSVLIGSDNGIFKSTDGFKTWRQVCEGDLIYKLAESDGLLIAQGVKGMLRSTDHGEQWESVNAENGSAIKTVFIKGGIAAIFIDQAKSSTQVNEYGMRNNLLASYDQGVTWKHLDDHFPSVRNIYDIEEAGEYLFCSLDTGIYRSIDQGKTWELVFPAKNKERFELMVTGNTIFAMLAQGC